MGNQDVRSHMSLRFPTRQTDTEKMRKFGGKTLSLDSDNLHLRNYGTFTKG